MEDAKRLERAMGIKWNMRGGLHRAPYPLPLLQHGIWELGDRFSHLQVHRRRLRDPSSVKQSIDTLFEKIGPILWPDPDVDRKGWLVHANEDKHGGLYCRNLYYSIGIDRGLLRRRFHALILHKLPSYLIERRKISKDARLRRYARNQHTPESTSSELLSLLDNVQSALDFTQHESSPRSTNGMAPPIATNGSTMPQTLKKHSRLLDELRHKPVSGHSMFYNADIESTTSAPSPEGSDDGMMLRPAVLATIRKAIADNKTTYKWRGVCYEIPANMQLSWHRANARMTDSPPRSDHRDITKNVVDLASDTPNSVPHKPTQISEYLNQTSEIRAMGPSVSPPDSAHTAFQRELPDILQEDNSRSVRNSPSRPNATYEHVSNNIAPRSEDVKPNLPVTSPLTTPSSPAEMDAALSAITLSIRYHVLAVERPKISLRACYTSRALFDRIRSHQPGLASKTIEAITVYLPSDRELRVREGNVQGFHELVRVMVGEGWKAAEVSVQWQ